METMTIEKADILSRFAERCTQAALEAFEIYGIIPYQGSGCLQIFEKNGFKIEQYSPFLGHPLSRIEAALKILRIVDDEFKTDISKADLFIITQGHAIAIRNGILIDTELKGWDRRIVQFAWIVTEIKCATCNHSMREHFEGRCNHLMTDKGWNVDTICQCH